MDSTILRSKLPQVGTSIFTVMSAMALDYKAINLSQGFPDFSCDPILTDLVNKFMRDGKNQYAPMPGVPHLQQAIADMMSTIYRSSYDPDTEITITSGASEALYCALSLVVHPGDEVIMFEPFYEAYLPIINMLHGKAICLTLPPPEFEIDWEEVKAHISPRTTAIMLNSPHNPTGSILTKNDLDQLTHIALNHDLLFISDEVYEHMVFDGKPHLSLSSVPAIAQKSMVIGSFGKSLHATGWKIGYCMAPKAISSEFRKLHQFVTFAVSTPFQYAIAAYLEDHLQKLIDLKHFYQRKRDLFLSEMRESRFEPIPSKGTYFQLMRYNNISDMDDVSFSHFLTQEKGVACIPISAFYIPEHQKKASHNQIVRFCFAKKDETLMEATNILRTM